MALAALLTALLGLGAVPGSPARAAEVKYDFEACAQGWEAKEGGNWVQGGALPGSSNTTNVMSNVLYPEDEERGDTLISKPHNWAGGKGKIKLRARWQFEWYPPEASAAVTTLDRAALEISTDGGKKWKSRAGFGLPNASFPEFDNLEVEFDAPAGQVLFRFVQFSDAYLTSFGIEIDDIVIPTAAPDGIGCK